MKNIRSIFTRFRLLNSVLVLVLMLIALRVTPVVRAQGCAWVCSWWTEQSGCISCSWCCVSPDGSYACEKKINQDCGTGGPGQELID
jgi:hypothetical protein